MRKKTKIEAVVPQKSVQARRRERKNMVVGYLFILPIVIHILVFQLVPILASLGLSFTDYDGLKTAKFVGIRNFVEMFTDDKYFWLSLRVTLKFAVVQVPLKLGFALIVAILLAKGSKATGIYRLCFYVPSLVGSSVAVATTWKVLWGNEGVINSLLEAVGMAPVNWLNNKVVTLYVLILLGVWQFGSIMLVFLGGIQSVPQTYHEAAVIDGANSWQRFWKITFPILTPSLFYNLVTTIIGCMQAFGSAFLITQGGPRNTTLYYSLHLYNTAFVNWEFGYACAMSWFMMLIITALTVLVFRSSNRWVFYQDERD